MAVSRHVLAIVAMLAVFPMGSVGTVVAEHARESGSSVQKVIKMLEDMTADAKRAKKDEEIAFSRFSTWCTEETRQMKEEIASAGASMNVLSADIGKLESDSEVLGRDIKELANNTDTMEADKKAATQQREKEHAEYLEESKDYGESVDALDRAIASLQRQAFDRPGESPTAATASALIQIKSKARMPARAKALVTGLLDMMSENDTAGDVDYFAMEAPKADAYKFQSGGIVAMLKKLRAEFAEKAGQCDKTEMRMKQAYELVVQDLTDSIALAQKDMAEKSNIKLRKDEAAATNTKELTALSAVKAEDEKTLSAVLTECSEKKLSFEEKQVTRAEEIQALMKAIEVMSSPEVFGSAEKHLSFAQGARRRGTVLLQLDGTSFSLNKGKSQGIHRRIRDFIAKEGRRLGSQRLALLAEQLAADPFSKVKKLIDGLITRLMEEANEDANHEGFCDKEVGKSKLTRTKLTEDIDRLSSAVDSGKAQISTLQEEVTSLTKELADIQTAMGEATEMRATEKAKNKQTMKEAKEAQEAVARATAVLKDFYSKASASTALLQENSMSHSSGVPMGSAEWESLANPNFEGTVDKGHKEGMQTFGETYSGQQDQAGGVLALLDVIAADFSSLEAEARTAEATSQETYEAFMVESKKNQAVKQKKVDMDNSDKATAEAQLQTDIKDLKSTQDQLLAANRYWEELEPQCIDKGVTFEERTQARQAEIDSLKEALNILNSEDIATSA